MRWDVDRVVGDRDATVAGQGLQGMVRAEGDVVVLDFRLRRSLFALFGEELSPPLVHQQHGEQRPTRLAIEGADASVGANWVSPASARSLAN